VRRRRLVLHPSGRRFEPCRAHAVQKAVRRSLEPPLARGDIGPGRPADVPIGCTTRSGHVPEQPVVGDPVRILGDPIGVVDHVVVSAAVIPLCAPCCDREVSPPVSHAKRTEVDVFGEGTVVVQQGVGGARIPVADDEAVDRGWLVYSSSGLREGEAPMLGNQSAGPPPLAMRSSTRLRRLLMPQSNGHWSTGSAS
jgi:hypothetical protein